MYLSLAGIPTGASRRVVQQLSAHPDARHNVRRRNGSGHRVRASHPVGGRFREIGAPDAGDHHQTAAPELARRPECGPCRRCPCGQCRCARRVRSPPRNTSAARPCSAFVATQRCRPPPAHRRNASRPAALSPACPVKADIVARPLARSGAITQPACCASPGRGASQTADEVPPVPTHPRGPRLRPSLFHLRARPAPATSWRNERRRR
jgi:hypothetical protein